MIDEIYIFFPVFPIFIFCLHRINIFFFSKAAYCDFLINLLLDLLLQMEMKHSKSTLYLTIF